MNLFTVFAEHLDCQESDLRLIEQLPWDTAFIRSISEERYSVREWNDFLSYIFDRPMQFDRVPEAKEFLIAHKAE